mmetsp:Transcript_107019/g.298032  ORF Transcript_107019/g.298032 Transcript_107019/m.298032 type:complete len:83 (+) Transcript_107019:90-338(+)
MGGKAAKDVSKQEAQNGTEADNPDKRAGNHGDRRAPSSNSPRRTSVNSDVSRSSSGSRKNGNGSASLTTKPRVPKSMRIAQR